MYFANLQKDQNTLKNALNISEFPAIKGMTPIVIIFVDRVDARAACCVAGFWLVRQTAEPQKLTQTKWFFWVLVKIASINCFALRFFSRNTQRYPVKAFSHDMRCGAVSVLIIAVRCGGGANVCGAVRWRWKKIVAVRWKHNFLSPRTSLFPVCKWC